MSQQQRPAKSKGNAPARGGRNRSPLSPAYDKKLDGPDRPST
ncbi:hypothetical protein ACF3MZ_19060 [Paenibacillaceae bacterium WGS1546]